MKKTYMIIAIAMLLIIFIVSIALSMVAEKSSNGLAIFDNMEELERALSECVTEDIKAESSSIDGLTPIDTFCKIVDFNSEKYMVYAYVFESDAEAIKYFERETGRNCDRIEKPYSCALSGNMWFNTRYVAFYNNRVLHVEGGNKTQFYQFTNFLFDNMPNAFWLVNSKTDE